MWRHAPGRRWRHRRAYRRAPELLFVLGEHAIRSAAEVKRFLTGFPFVVAGLQDCEVA